MATNEISAAAFMARLAQETPVGTILRTPAQLAFAAIAQLQTDLAAASAAIKSVPFGPFDLSGSCDYDCFIGICLKTEHWGFKMDFSGMREPLQDAVQRVVNAAGDYNTAFQPARTWLKTTLPQFSADFASQAQLILTTTADVRAAGGKATAAQLVSVQGAFQSITAGLGTGQSQMGTAVQAVAQFIQSLNAVENYIGQFIANMQASNDRDIANAQNNFVNGLHCGGGDADNQINGAMVIFNTSVSVIRANFAQIDTDTQAVAASTGQFVATLVNVMDQYQNVAGQVKSSETYPAGVIQDLHLDIAANEWAQLAQYAAANIQ